MFTGILKKSLDSLKGMVIAIVYTFEKEDAPGFGHYHVWKSDIIAAWLCAVQELDCVPFILDVRTFVQKALNGTLPRVDYVVNLNCGSQILSSMSLVPSTCSFISVPCIPCNAVSIVAGENKKISNLLARSMKLNVPCDLNPSCEGGVYRPLNLGSSIGLRIGYPSDNVTEGVYQEFILGFDVAIPIAYNPALHDIDILPPVVYVPKSLDPSWMYNSEEKINDDGFTIQCITQVEERTRKAILAFAKLFPVETFGRIDARLKSTGKKLADGLEQMVLQGEDLFFLEINTMPTIEGDDSFEYSYKRASSHEQHSFCAYIQAYNDFIKKPSINGFLLSCSMLALSRAKY